ncbi:unnamed protein product [Urochloa humidicola]
MDDAKKEEIRAFLKAHAAELRRTARERMTSLADDCEYARKHKHASLIPPPIEMLDHPDLFERAWGWDMILPHNHTTPWSQFKKYLLAYYHHNQKEANAVGGADDEGNGLASLARSCIEMEKHLLLLWNKYATIYPTDDLEMKQMIEKVINRAQEMLNARKSEFPAAAIALKCITEEAELMCGWLRAKNTSPIYYIGISNEIRECALSLMVCKGPEHVLAMAAMMGILKENKVVHQFLCNLTDKNDSNLTDKNDSNLTDTHRSMPMSLFIRGHTLGAMLGICDDCSAEEDSSGGSTAGKCMPNESDGNTFSENKLVDKLEDESNLKSCSMTMMDMAEQDSLQDTNDTNKNTNIGSEMEEVKKDDAMGSSNAEESACDGSADKNCSEKKLLRKEDVWEGDEIDQDTKDLEKEGSVVDMGETKQSNKSDGRSSSETERVKRDNTMERNEKQKLREWWALEDDREFVGGNNSSVEEEVDKKSSPKKNLISLELKKKPKEEPQIVPASTEGTSISEPKIISENVSSVETQDKDVILEGLSTVSSHDEWAPLSISGHRPKPRNEHGATVLQDNMYVFGGNHNGRYLSDLQALDLKSLTWSNIDAKLHAESSDSAKTSQIAPCAGHSLITWGNNIFSIAGHTKDPSEGITVKEFDLHTCTWSDVRTYGKSPVSRRGQTVTLVGTTLVLFGGEDAKRCLLNDLHILDLETMTWDDVDAVGTPPPPRSDHAAACHADRYLLIFGGASHASFFNDLHVLDLHTMEWSRPRQQGLTPSPRAGHAGATVGENWYIVGGGNNKSGVSETLVLNMSTLTWSVFSTVEGQVPLASEGMTLVHSNYNGYDYLISFGGYNG